MCGMSDWHSEMIDVTCVMCALPSPLVDADCGTKSSEPLLISTAELSLSVLAVL